MFDYLYCRYPLPVQGATDLQYQTKDLDCLMDVYEIREDGTLWHEEYEVEDHSDPTAEGLMRLRGMLSRVNKRWEQVHGFTGEVVFGALLGAAPYGHIDWSAYFVDGKLNQVHLLAHEQPPPNDAVARADERVTG